MLGIKNNRFCPTSDDIMNQVAEETGLRLFFCMPIMKKLRKIACFSLTRTNARYVLGDRIRLGPGISISTVLEAKYLWTKTRIVWPSVALIYTYSNTDRAWIFRGVARTFHDDDRGYIPDYCTIGWPEEVELDEMINQYFWGNEED